jgi:hypothetical protein
MPEQVSLTTDPSTTMYAGFLLDRYGAPKLSELTACNVPPMEDPPNYLGSFVLNSIFMMTYPDPLGRIVLIFGRRVIHAIREYRAGREILATYVEKLHQTNSHFLQAMRATSHFEQCVASACQAAALLERIVKLIPDVPPEQKDEREVRLKKIWNRSKHFDEDVVSSKVLDAEITAPVWLTNQGISSRTASVTFDELHSILGSLRDALKFFAEDMPNRYIALQKGKG